MRSWLSFLSFKLPSIRSLYVRVIVLVIICLSLVYYFVPYETRSYLLHGKPYTACNVETIKKCKSYEGRPQIPNILHFVYILEDTNKDFPFQFTHFLSIFAASHYWQPESIYLHTNVASDSDSILRAKNGTTGKWSRLIFTLPNLSVNTVEVPTHTRTGRRIELMEHKSDFVRVQAVHDIGGIYIDTDVHALRDINVLRLTGYKAVGGRELLGKVNSGTFMAEKEGKMITKWLERMHKVYDGGWVTHSNIALTHVAESLESEPCEMLIMGRDAFAPGSWEIGDVENLFNVHSEETLSPATNATEESGPSADIEGAREPMDVRPSWARDWSCTYLLHAWSRAKPRDGVNHNGITPRTVMERRSNFARAVFPITKIMYEKGIVSDDDTDTGL